MSKLTAALLLAVLSVFSVAASAAQSQPAAPAAQSDEDEGPVVDLTQITDVNALVAMASRLQTEGEFDGAVRVWERVRQLRPHNPHYVFELVAAYAGKGDLPQAYNALLIMQRAGAAYDLAGDARMAPLRGTEVWDYLVALFDDAREKAFGDGELAFELAPRDLLLESIARHPGNGDFLFGSARDGVIYRRGRDGQVQPWARPQGESWWGLFDLRVDAGRGVLWATTAAVPHFQGFKAEQGGRSALLKLSLEDGSLIAAYPAPEDGLPHVLNTIAVSPRGQVIVAEGLRGQLFRLGESALEPLMAEPRLNRLRGLAFSGDGNTLYFSDYDMGLFGLDLTRGMAFDVRHPGAVILHGIEDIFVYEGQIVAIQSGTSPQRVLRIKLDDAGRAIAQAVPIEANQPGFDSPTRGVLVDDQLYYIANTQRGYYDSYGLLRSGRELPPVRVFRTPVRFNWDFEPPRLPDHLVPRPGE
ncbi:MAG: hypothetical protein KF823_12420 [Xanthomonadales bacterium]|nr:hypothetical protein [Xanthomonadales bacterium]